MSEFDAKQYWEATVHNRRKTLDFYGGLDSAGRAVLFAADRISELESRLAAAEAAINAALDALNDAPEINPSNYDHDQVCALNREACFAFSILNDHVAARGGE